MEQVLLSQPKLRSGVQLTMTDGGASLRQGDLCCNLTYPSDASAAVGRLLERLKEGGRSLSEIEACCPELDGLAEIIATLDASRLLTESVFLRASDAISGIQLYREVRRIAERLTAQIATSRFYDALLTGAASRQQLVGYALEYYWLVRAAPALIAPSLATAPALKQKRILQEFLASELNHDTYLASALAAVGIDVAPLELLQPLPTTFSICASLGVYAHQHPISFYAALFLFEEPREPFVLAFEQRCRELRLPESFHKPFRWHAELNVDADHDEISAALLEVVPVVDRETQTVVKRNVSVLVETMLRQESEILDYYGDESLPAPRLFG